MSNSLQTSAHRKFSLIRHVEETYKSDLEPKPRAGARCVDTVRIMGDYFFLSSWAGGILQILQSDWFREWAVLSPSGPLTAGGSFRNHWLGFRGRGPRAVSKTSGTVFPNTDLPLVNNIYLAFRDLK